MAIEERRELISINTTFNANGDLLNGHKIYSVCYFDNEKNCELFSKLDYEYFASKEEFFEYFKSLGE